MWSEMVDANPEINRLIDASAFQDAEDHTMYYEAGNNTVFYYLATQIKNRTSQDYHSLMRTFPGVAKNMTKGVYDPVGRSWFKQAPEGSYYLQAYKETFTRQDVINVASKAIHTDSVYTYTFVSAAVMLLSSLREIIYAVKYSNEGFGALVNTNTLEVLCWKEVGSWFTKYVCLSVFPISFVFPAASN